MNYSGKNRRKFTRIQFQTPARLHNSIHSWDFEVSDISFKGVLLKVAKDWLAKIGESFEVEIPLSELQPNFFIRMKVKLIHREETKAGFCWEEIDINSFTHLHRLIEANLRDEKLMHREVKNLEEYQKEHQA